MGLFYIRKIFKVLLSIGLGTFLCGFIYGGVMVGVPYQDPTPEMLQKQNFHNMISDYILTAGIVISLASAAGLAICFCIKKIREKYA